MTGARVYVASPLGFAAPGQHYLRAVLHPTLANEGFVLLDPWDDPDGSTAATLAIAPHDPARRAALTALNTRLGATNAASIIAADAVLAVLDGPDVDSGTAAEIGFAAAQATPVVGLRTDSRLSGDNEAAPVNLQVLFFIESSGGHLTTTLPEAIAALHATTAAPRAEATDADETHADELGADEADSDRFVYHLAFRADWDEAVRAGAYRHSTRGASLDDVGFIHASFAHQLPATAQRFFADVAPDDLVVLQIDRTRLQPPLVVEANPATGELFPHLYGPLNPGAVTALLPPP